MRVLLVQEDAQLAAARRRELLGHDLAVELAVKADDAVHMARATSYDAIAVDVARPGIAALAPSLRLRRADVAAPILLIVDPGTDTTPVDGRDGPVDAVLVRPVSASALAMWIREVTARGPRRPRRLRAGDLVVDPSRRGSPARAPRSRSRSASSPCWRR